MNSLKFIRQAVLLYIPIFLMLVSCSENKSMKRVYSQDYYNYSGKFSKHIVRGEYDSLVMYSKELYEIADEKNDTLSLLFSGFMTSQAFFFLNEPDSTKLWLDRTIEINSVCHDVGIEMCLNHLKGVNKLFDELDYHGALKCFEDGLRIAQDNENLKMQMTFLTDIINIFYARNDKYGMVYAKEIIRLYDEYNEKISDIDKCMALVSVAEMLYLNGEYDKTLNYVHETENIAKAHEIYSYDDIIYLLYADVYSQKGEYLLAEAFYKKALQVTGDGPSMYILINMNYGIHKERNGMYGEAISLYKEALAAVGKYDIFLYKGDILRRLFKLALYIKDNKMAVEYGSEYLDFTDKVSTNSSDQEFYNLLQSYNNSKYDIKAYKNKLALEKANYVILIYASVSLLILMALIFIWSLYRRRQKMYRSLFLQYQNNLKMLSGEDGKKENDEKLSSIFSEIDRLMKTDKIYKRKDISLDTLANMLCTNRDYISKSINLCTGSSFNNYINMYRISEAVDILSCKDKDILLKSLSEDLGYSSLAVFSRAFMNRMGCSASSYRNNICNS